MAQQLTIQACFAGYFFSFIVAGLVWLVRKDNADRGSYSTVTE